MLTENINDISDKFKNTKEIIDSCFDDIKKLNLDIIDNVNFEDPVLSSRVNDIRGKVD